jgi:hypothetical protein
LGQPATDERLEAGLRDRDHTGSQTRDPLSVEVDRTNSMAQMGEARSRDQTDMTGANHHDMEADRT